MLNLYVVAMQLNEGAVHLMVMKPWQISFLLLNSLRTFESCISNECMCHFIDYQYSVGSCAKGNKPKQYKIATSILQYSNMIIAIYRVSIKAFSYPDIGYLVIAIAFRIRLNHMSGNIIMICSFILHHI